MSEAIQWPPPWWPKPKPKHKPQTPGKPFLELVFRYYPSDGDYTVTGIVTPSPAVSSDQDTDMQITVVLNGTTLPVLDCGPPPGNTVTFSCNAGDTGTIVQDDINAVGTSPSSTPLAFTVPTIIPPPTNVPQTPGQPTVTFTDP
jgi:hypothetical protein